MKIIKISDPHLKSEICNTILRALPDWFGIESAIVDYVKAVPTMDTWVIYNGANPVGFMSLHAHFKTTAEIHVMGILENYHRQGLGQKMLKLAEADLRDHGFKFLTVKTLSESRVNKEFEQTRKFYLKMGFTPLEEFKTLWGEHNPCLFLAKAL